MFGCDVTDYFVMGLLCVKLAKNDRKCRENAQNVKISVKIMEILSFDSEHVVVRHYSDE